LTESALRQLLESIRSGSCSVDEAVSRLRLLPYEDLGFAKVDHHRAIRCGFPEVIYCEGKTPDQAAAIFGRCAAAGHNVLATRVTPAIFEEIVKRHPLARFEAAARAVTLRQREPGPNMGTVAVVSAGTSDMPVAEEARVTAEMMDQTTRTFYDVGVAGLHRLLSSAEAIRSAGVAVVVAGMEGALASVVGGLVDFPVIAVPTSVGYGASFGGLAALLAMLNSCAANVAVVNIDNGFGAAYVASLINWRTSRNTSLG
jgi:hypothetical protein